MTYWAMVEYSGAKKTNSLTPLVLGHYTARRLSTQPRNLAVVGHRLVLNDALNCDELYVIV